MRGLPGSLLPIAVACAALLLPLSFGAAPASAQELAPFRVRYTTNDNARLIQIGNTLMTCPDSGPASANCPAARAASPPLSGSDLNDNNYLMRYVDVDGDPATFNSSTADLTPPDGAEVLFAGLYWGADTSRGGSGAAALTPGARLNVKLRTPASGGYLDLPGTLAGQGGSGSTRYHAFYDVTDLVRAAGSGTYTMA